MPTDRSSESPTHPDAPRAGGETQAEQDFRERLASIKRCIPHMHDVGGIWPRDVEWLIAELERSRSDARERHRDGERADWWEAETRRVLQAVWAEGTDTTERVTRLALNLRPANEQTPPPSVRDRVREERETIPEPTHD